MEDEVILMKTIIFMSIIQSNAFMFSYFGTKLMEESAAVGEEIANLPWYNIKSKSIQKYLILIQLRAQKPVGITAGKFYFISFKSFTESCNTIYNYFAILQTILENKN